MCFTVTLGLVAKDDAHVESAVVASDQSFIFVSDHVFSTLVHPVPDIDDSFLDKDDFVYIVQLFENDGVPSHVSILHLPQKRYHEITVNHIFPGVSYSLRIFNGEKLSKSPQKVTIVVFTVNFGLRLLR